MKIKFLSGNPLKIICVIGFILALIIVWGLVIYNLTLGKNSGLLKTQGKAFTRNLKNYDLYNAPKRVMDGEDPKQIEKRLTALQKRAKSTEEQLSVLKRRRALALLDRQYIVSYAKAAQQAAEAFTYSVPLAAVAAEATLMVPLSEEKSALLSAYALRITQNRFDLLELSMHILAGNLDDPARAARMDLQAFLSQDLSALPEQIQKELLADEFLLLVYRQNIPSASQRLNTLLQGTDPDLLRMGAEFYYDHGFPHRAAELFIRLAESPGGEAYSGRAADSLALAGEIPGARNIWLALSVPSQAEDSSSRQTRLRSYYNLASSAQNPGEETSWLERLFAQSATLQGVSPDMETYSVIRYTRLLDAPRGIAVLEDKSMTANPLLDLELLRRKMEEWPSRRSIAEVWLLINRHSDNRALYEWAFWYFEHQKLYSEITQLLIEAERKEMTGASLALHKSLALIREQKISEAEEILKETLKDYPDWRIYANLGRIQESKRSIQGALDYYETAAALVREKPAAAQIQMRISRCLEAQGRSAESRRALEYAHELDSENLNIRMALRRLNSNP